ncbi:hypothetical protein [Microbulbifer pacificus]|uniref:hypothetical protein n=1 Tax=Microbulbifer pacificus TaxID=407164 RepID=UPI001319C623|nr:hypothetical protein [Microbulbifer pacificus]
MRPVILIFTVILSGCIAVPRGDYYRPVHPEGKTSSRTCDPGGNQEILSLEIRPGVTFQSSINTSETSEKDIWVSFRIEDGHELELASNILEVSIDGTAFSTSKIDSWSPINLKGGTEVYFINGKKFDDAKSFSGKVNIGILDPEKISLRTPAIYIDRETIRVLDVEFELRSGELQWVPRLNC